MATSAAVGSASAVIVSGRPIGKVHANVTWSTAPPAAELYRANASPLPPSPSDDVVAVADVASTAAADDVVRESANPEIYELLLQSVLVPTICCLGILGNALSILVLTRQRIRRSVKTPDQIVHVGLVSLAVSDMIVCLSTLPQAFIPEFYVAFPDGPTLVFYYQMYSTGLITTFSLISTWLIVVTAAMRYAVICYPLRSRSTTSGHRCGFAAIAATYVICILGNVPSFYLFSATEHMTSSSSSLSWSSSNYSSSMNLSSTTNSSSSSSSSSSLSSSLSATTTTTSVMLLIDLGPFNHMTRPGLAFHWIKAFASIFIPGALLGFFNIRLIQALRESDRLRDAHAPRRCSSATGSGGVGDGRCGAPTTAAAAAVAAVNSATAAAAAASGRGYRRTSTARNRLNVTLVAVIVMFVCLVLPCELLDFVAHLTPLGGNAGSGNGVGAKTDGFVDREAFMLARMVLNAAQLSNFAFNFVLYCTLNAQFRRALTDWCCHRWNARVAKILGHPIAARGAGGRGGGCAAINGVVRCEFKAAAAPANGVTDSRRIGRVTLIGQSAAAGGGSGGVDGDRLAAATCGGSWAPSAAAAAAAAAVVAAAAGSEAGIASGGHGGGSSLMATSRAAQKLRTASRSRTSSSTAK